MSRLVGDLSSEVNSTITIIGNEAHSWHRLDAISKLSILC
jgi:hypothetical protein